MQYHTEGYDGAELAIAVHKQAKWIYKLDEDIFISEAFFDSLLEGYLHIKDGETDEKEGLKNQVDVLVH
ncbi:hypothetical protein HW132_11070 [Brasilonema sp. CT11]|nr:hypothetical protein [Brasilonema sp. CT11]